MLRPARECDCRSVKLRKHGVAGLRMGKLLVKLIVGVGFGVWYPGLFDWPNVRTRGARALR